MQTVTFDAPGYYNTFGTVHFGNPNIYFATDIYSLTLQQDMLLEQDLTILSALDLNQSTFVVLGELTYVTLNHSEGNLINLSCVDQRLTVQAELGSREEITFVAAGYTEAGQLADCKVYCVTPESEMTFYEIDLSQWEGLDSIKVYTLDHNKAPLVPAYLCGSMEQVF